MAIGLYYGKKQSAQPLLALDSGDNIQETSAEEEVGHSTIPGRVYQELYRNSAMTLLYWDF